VTLSSNVAKSARRREDELKKEFLMERCGVILLTGEIDHMIVAAGSDTTRRQIEEI
jgi:hypothetical protein